MIADNKDFMSFQLLQIPLCCSITFIAEITQDVYGIIWLYAVIPVFYQHKIGAVVRMVN